MESTLKDQAGVQVDLRPLSIKARFPAQQGRRSSHSASITGEIPTPGDPSLGGRGWQRGAVAAVLHPF